MHALSSMSSCTDAHLERELPVIAANLHNLMLPRQCQIWCTLKPEYSDTKLRYVLGGGMLGRMCLSGAITALSPEQWSIVERAMDFYEHIKGVIKKGTSAFWPCHSLSRRHLRGGLVLRRCSHDGNAAILYFFVFDEPPAELVAELPSGDWRLADYFGEGAFEAGAAGCVFRPAAAWSCYIALMEKKKKSDGADSPSRKGLA